MPEVAQLLQGRLVDVAGPGLDVHGALLEPGLHLGDGRGGPRGGRPQVALEPGREAAAEKYAYDKGEKYCRSLQALEQAFREEYADPTGLTTNEDHEAYVLFLLAGRSEYEKYQEESGTDLRHARAHYDPAMRVCVSYIQQGHESETSNWHSALHELVHAFEHAFYEHGAGGMPHATWFKEGFAEYLAYAQQVRVEVKRKQEDRRRGFILDAVRAMAPRLSAEPTLAACIVPLEELSRIQSYGDAQRRLNDRAKRNGYPGTLSEEDALTFLYKQSYLYMEFLHHWDEGKYLPTVQEYVAALLRGDSGRKAFEKTFGRLDQDELNEGFLAFLEENGAAPVVPMIRATW